MDRRNPTHYDVLGVDPDAKLHDVRLALKRHEDAMRAETTPPDARRDKRVREAYAVLADPEQRAAYDAALVPTMQERLGPFARRPVQIGTAAVIAIVGAVGVSLLSRKPPPSVAERPVSEVKSAATLAVGRLQVLEMSGGTRTAATAVTIAEGMMVAPCSGLAAEAQLRVLSGTATRAARVVETAPRGDCRIAVSEGAGFPLFVADSPPSLGERVYVVAASATGEAVLSEGTLVRVEGSGEQRIFVASIAPPADGEGAVLLDARARVLGIAMRDASGALAFRPPSRAVRA